MGVALDVGPEKTPGLKSYTVNAETGEVTAKMTQELVQSLLEKGQNWDRAMVGMQDELDRISVQEEKARSMPPLLGILQKLGANLAMQPDQPGVVRALGMTSAQVNPDPDALAARKLPLYQQILEMENRRRGEHTQALQTILGMEDRALQRAAVSGQKATTEETRRLGQLELAVQRGNATPELIRRLVPGASPEEVESYLKQSADNKRRSAAIETSQALENEERAAQLRTRQDLDKAQAEYARARARMTGAVGAQKASTMEAQARYYHAQAGFREQETALAVSRFALDLERFERGTDKVKLDAALALAELPWLTDEQKAQYQAAADALQKKHGNVGERVGRPAVVQSSSPTRVLPAEAAHGPKVGKVFSGRIVESGGEKYRKEADGWYVLKAGEWVKKGR